MSDVRVPKIQRFYAGTFNCFTSAHQKRCGIWKYDSVALFAGPFFKSLTKAMNRTANGNSTQLFNFYSGHDSTIMVMMIALGIYNNIDPPYSAALIFELRQKSNEKIVTVNRTWKFLLSIQITKFFTSRIVNFQVFYSNSTNTTPHFIEIPKCKSPCTFENFVNLTSQLVITDWKEECRVERWRNIYLQKLNTSKYSRRSPSLDKIKLLYRCWTDDWKIPVLCSLQ